MNRAMRRAQVKSSPKKHKTANLSLPLCITDVIAKASGRLGTIDAIEANVRLNLSQLLAGGVKDRSPMDSIGKFIALCRYVALEQDLVRGGDKSMNGVWAVMVMAAERWRDIETRWLQKQVISLNADERNAMLVAVDVGITQLSRATESLVDHCFVRLENELQVRALLGFNPDTGEDNMDDGKLELMLGVA